MNTRLRTLILLAATFGALLSAHAQPGPGRRSPGAGTCRLTPQTTVCYEKPLAPLVDYLLRYINVTGASDSMSADGAIVLSLDNSLGEEAFRFTAKPDRIEIAGGSYGGVFNGIQAFFRLLPPEVYARDLKYPVEIACGTVTDAPRFAYRGMMLDVARTWMDADAVMRYIDLLSYHSINKLHLHLSDDEGWRIEIKSHPEFTEIGGFRGGDSPVRAVYGKWGEKYGGYYTQEQMRAIVAYAAARNIEIIPEIDLPGHSRNIASVRPEIRCDYPADTVSTNGYDYRSAWCVAREENYALLADILSEICRLFPSKYIHVGGDEVDLTQWESCPDCKALLKRKGMTDAHQLEDLFMERMAAILKANGKSPGVWNEAATTGDFTRESLVYGWENVKACLDATAKGYRTVVMPGEYFYFDMRQTPREDGHDWAAIFDAKKVFGFDLADKGFAPEQMRNIAGLEGTFFSEAYISHEPEKPDYLDYMCFPRICALARIAWSGNGEGWETYYKELTGKHYDRMAAMGIRFRLFPPKLTYKEGMFTATTDDGAEIYYIKEDSRRGSGSNSGTGSDSGSRAASGTDSGSEAGVENTPAHRYTGPLKTDKPHLYRFFTRYKTARSPYVADNSYYRTVKPAVTISTTMGESEQFPYTNASTYKGLSRTRRACRQQDRIVYTFEQPVRCREMYLQTGNRQLPKTILTTGYAEVSYDGISYERLGDLNMGSITLHPDRPVKAVRLTSTCNDNGTPYVTIQPPVIKPIL